MGECCSKQEDGPELVDQPNQKIDAPSVVEDKKQVQQVDQQAQDAAATKLQSAYKGSKVRRDLKREQEEEAELMRQVQQHSTSTGFDFPLEEIKEARKTALTMKRCADPFTYADGTKKLEGHKVKVMLDADGQGIYKGETKGKDAKGQDIKHGKGDFTWKDGTIYSGNWVDNKANGHGRIQYKDNGTYEGNFVNDQAQGKGKFTYISGVVYEGEWKNNMQHGKGVELFPNGDRFEGTFVEGEKTGKGKMTWVDGNSYEGNYLKGEFNGEGHYTWDDKREYRGAYVNGQQQGKGTYTWPDGRMYVGEYHQDKK